MGNLRALALAATPGPWKVGEINPDTVWTVNGGDVVGQYGTTPSDCAFIAAANPTVVLGLLADRNAILEEVATWYATQGWLLDEGDVPEAIRGLKVATPPATAERSSLQGLIDALTEIKFCCASPAASVMRNIATKALAGVAQPSGGLHE